MKVALSGSTGFVGRNLKRFLESKGCRIIRITRSDFADYKSVLPGKLKDVEVVIHLAGAPILSKWTEVYKEEIYDSRVITTRRLVEVMQGMKQGPKLFVSTSAAGIYPNGVPATEKTQDFNDGFLGQLCQDWEQEALKAQNETRVVIFRLGLILGRNGGLLSSLNSSLRFGFGGKLGTGKQQMSWVHIMDLLHAYWFVVRNKQLSGVYNLTSPQPVQNRVFSRQLAKCMKRPAWFRIPVFVIKALFGEVAEVMVADQEVYPERIQEAGFRFKYDTLEAALKNIFAAGPLRKPRKKTSKVVPKGNSQRSAAGSAPRKPGGSRPNSRNRPNGRKPGGRPKKGDQAGGGSPQTEGKTPQNRTHSGRRPQNRNAKRPEEKNIGGAEKEQKTKSRNSGRPKVQHAKKSGTKADQKSAQGEVKKPRPKGDKPANKPAGSASRRRPNQGPRREQKPRPPKKDPSANQD